MSVNRSRYSSRPSLEIAPIARLRFAMWALVAVFVWGCDSNRAGAVLAPEDGPGQPVSQETVFSLVLEVDPATGVVGVADVSSPDFWSANKQVPVDHLLEEVSFVCTDCGKATTRIRNLELTVVVNDNTKKLHNLGFTAKRVTENCNIGSIDTNNAIDPLQTFYTVSDPVTVKFPVKLTAPGNFRVSVTFKASVHAV
jgi:hypothetical protein